MYETLALRQRLTARCSCVSARATGSASRASHGPDAAAAFIRSAGRALSGWQREAFALRTDHNLAQLALIRASAGIGICRSALARRDNSMVRLFTRQFSLQLDTWITMHEDLRTSPRCRVTFDALLEGLKRYIK